MKIVLITHKFLPKWVGGTEIFTYNLARNLQARNHEVHVITSLDEESFDEYKEFHTYRIYFPKIKIFGFSLFLIQIFIRIIKIKPDIIQLNGLHLISLGLILKKVLKIPYVLRGSGSDIYFPNKFNKLLLKIAINNSSRVIALTEYMKKQMNYSLNKIQVIPNGIDINNFEIRKVHARQKLGIDKNKKIITFVGSLRPIKGVEYLIKAIHLLKDEYDHYNDLEVLIIGNGNQRQYLEELTIELNIDHSIDFIGEIPNQMIPIYLAASDIFILPSLSEGFGIVLIEAMASGLPIIATNVTGIIETIENKKNGLLVEPKKPDEIAAKIIILMEDENLYKKIVVNNKNKAKEYTWTNIVNKYEEVYDEILS